MMDARTMKPAGPALSGLLVLVVGPSGAGKDTLIMMARDILADDRNIRFPRRVVTRDQSPSEDNEAITPEAFDDAVASDAFALWWRAHGHGYGIRRSIDEDLRQGRTIVMNVSRAVVANAREVYPNTAVVLITAPDHVLAERLALRQRSSDHALDHRLRRASLVVDAPDAVIDNIGSPKNHGQDFAAMIRARFGRPETPRAGNGG